MVSKLKQCKAKATRRVIKRLQCETLESRQLLSTNPVGFEPSIQATRPVAISSDTWKVTSFEISSPGNTDQALPWMNLNTLEVSFADDYEILGSEIVMYGTRPYDGSAAPLVPTEFVEQSNGVGKWHFENLPSGHYILDINGDQQIPFSVLHGNSSPKGEAHRVGFSDFAALAKNFGVETTDPLGPDFNGDGRTGFFDFATLAKNFGAQLPGVEFAPTSDDIPRFDYGDAPDAPDVASYRTLSENDGARHRIVYGGPILGTRIDADLNGQPSLAAVGDDTPSSLGIDDEDGLVELQTFGTRGRAVVEVTAEPGTSPLLDGWIDFNADGDWDDEGEQIFKNRAVVDGVNELEFDVPAGAATPGLGLGEQAIDTYMRLRISSDGDLSPLGEAADGEVEDYGLKIVTSYIDIPEVPGVPVPGDGPEGGDDKGGGDDDSKGGDEGGNQGGENDANEYKPELTEISQDEGLPDDFVGTELPENALENEGSARPIHEIIEEIKAAEGAGSQNGLDILHAELDEARATQVTDIPATELMKSEGETREEHAERLAKLVVETRGLGDRFPYAQLLKKWLLNTEFGENCEFEKLTIRVNPDDSIQLIFESESRGTNVVTARFGQTTEFQGQSGSGLIVYAPTLSPYEESGRRMFEYLPNCQRLLWRTIGIENGLEYRIDLQAPAAGGSWDTIGSEVVGTATAGERVSVLRYIYENPGESVQAGAEGLWIGFRATTNGVVDGVTSFVTIGTISDGPDVFEISRVDRFFGATASEKLASGATQVGIGLAGGASNGVTRVIQVLDTANNATTLGGGIVDIAENGVTIENGLKTGTAAVGLGANLTGATDEIAEAAANASK